MGHAEQKLTLFLMFFLMILQLGWTQGEKNITKHYSSSYGVPCDDTCDTHKKDYQWCATKKGWDYCSRKENTDYKGQTCREDHPCQKYGKSYHWCYVEGGGWGYCGLVRNAAEPKALLYKGSSYLSVCWDECMYDENKKYFWCHTAEGWDFCSPLPEVTSQNEPCRLDHFCGTHGYAYTWCFTNSGSGYCGVISPGECQHVVPELTKEDSKTMISCKWKDSKNEKEIKFNAEPDLTVSTEGSTWKNEMINFIALWKNIYLSPDPRSKMITSNNLRFDVQKLVNKEGQSYYNLQIMVNVQAQTGRRTSLALVVVPEYEIVPDRFIHLAFVESFRLRSRISVEVNNISADIS